MWTFFAQKLGLQKGNKVERKINNTIQKKKYNRILNYGLFTLLTMILLTYCAHHSWFMNSSLRECIKTVEQLIIIGSLNISHTMCEQGNKGILLSKR
jgi:hypothetical protein